MKKLHIDIETYSEEDLKKCGMYKYSQHPSFQVILIAYAFDDSPVKILDMTSQHEMTAEEVFDYDKVVEALTNPNVIKVAHNAAFERTCLAAAFLMDLPAEQWECTMIKAAYAGLPMALGSVASVLKLPVEKDLRGIGLIKYFCLPCRPTKTNGERTRNLPNHAPEKWEAFKEYCVKDVEVEMAIDRHLSWLTISDFEKGLWALDQRINDRGILLDKRFVRNAIQIDTDYRAKLMEEAIRITGLDNPNSTSQLSRWFEQETGDAVETLKKADIPVMLQKYDDDLIQRVLRIRQELSKTSVKKYVAMAHAVCNDGRVRGLIQFYGANRTGRFASRLVQIHNLPQNHLADLDLARTLVRDNDPEMLEMCYGNIPDTLSQLIRTSFVAGKDKILGVSDFSAIEARVLAWIAGEQWRLDVFNTHGKIYEASASAMFSVPLESVTKGSDLRQKGKVSELACIAKGQLVLTDRGLIPIQDVKLNDKVWDGIRFCRHEGVIFKGLKQTITYEGLTATADHLVWVEGNEEPVRFIDAAKSGSYLKKPKISWGSVWKSKNNITRKKVDAGLDTGHGFSTVSNLPTHILDRLEQFKTRKIKRVPKLLTAKADTFLARQKIDCGQTTLRKPKRQRVQELWGEGDSLRVQVRHGSRALSHAVVSEPRQSARIRPNRQRGALRKRKFAIHESQRKQFKQAMYCYEKLGSRRMALFVHSNPAVFSQRFEQRTNNCFSKKSSTGQTKKLEINSREIEVYDILNAGPLNRFTVSGVLVHNCGYQGGVGALINMGALKMGLKEEDLQGLITAWREANPAIVDFWNKVQKAAISALKGNPVRYKGLRFGVLRGAMHIELPSGRRLQYFNARLATNKWGGESIKYEGVDPDTKQWGWVDTYGGKLTENIVQAIARDCLAEALVKVDKAGFDLVMHVHDELIAVLDEKTAETDLEIINGIMGEELPWAKGLPLKGDGYLTKYYKKD